MLYLKKRPRFPRFPENKKNNVKQLVNINILQKGELKPSGPSILSRYVYDGSKLTIYLSGKLYGEEKKENEDEY